MNETQVLFNPALQDQFSLLDDEFDHSVNVDVALNPNAQQFIPLPKSVEELEYFVSSCCTSMYELHDYCNRVSASLSTYENTIQPYSIEKVKKTYEKLLTKERPFAVRDIRQRKSDSAHGWGKKRSINKLVVNSRPEFASRDVSDLRENSLWVIPSPKRVYPSFGKPDSKHYSRHAFKCWIYSEFARLSTMIKYKNQKIVGSAGAKLLFLCENVEIMHKSVLDSNLLDARVWIHTFSNDEPKKAKGRLISDFLPQRRFLYYGNRVITKDNIYTFESYFKRHKPRFFAVHQFIVNGAPLDASLLQKEVDEVVQSNLPKNLIFEGEVFNKERIVSLSSVLPFGLYQLCIRHFANDTSVNYGALRSSFSRFMKTVPPTVYMEQSSGQHFSVPEEFGVPGSPDYCINFPQMMPNQVTSLELVDEEVLRIKESEKVSLLRSSKISNPMPSMSLPSFIPSSMEILGPLKDMLEYFNSTDLREVTRFLLFLLTLHEQRSWKGCLLVVSSYVISSNDEWWKLALSKLEKLTPPTFRFEANESETVPPAFSVWDSLSLVTEWGKELFNALAELMLKTILPGLLPESFHGFITTSSFATGFVDKVRIELLKTTAKTVAQGIIDTFFRLFALVKKCIRLKSIYPLFMEVFDPISWKYEATAIVTFYSELQSTPGVQTDTRRWNELRTTGKIPFDWYEPFSPQELSTRIDNLIDSAVTFCDTFRTDLVLLSDVKKVLAQLRALQESTSTSYGVMAARPQPFGIYFAGVAGSGKTGLADACFKAIGRANGYSTENTMKYSWMRGVNFQDGLGPSQWCIMLDDIDANPAQPVMGQETHVDAVIKIINNAALPIEQSRVEAKGKFSAKPLLVTMTSNFERPRLQGYALGPTQPAFYRRFPLYVKVAAKDQFGSNGKLDAAKAALSTDGEVSTLEVYRHDSSILPNGGTYFPYSLVGTMTKRDFLLLVAKLYREHMDLQIKYLQMQATETYCPICYADWNQDTKCLCANNPQVRSLYFALPLALVAGYRWLPLVFRNEREWVGRLVNSISNTIENGKNATTDAALLISDVKLDYESFKDRIAKFFVVDIKYLAGAIAFAGCANVLWMYYKDYQESQILNKEEIVENNAVVGSVPTAWVRAPQEFKPGMPIEYSTFTKDDAIKHIQSSYVLVESDIGVVHGLVVSHQGVVCPLHVFGPLSQFTGIPETSSRKFFVKQKGITHELLYNKFNVHRIATDIVFIRVSPLTGFTGVGKKVWVELDNSVSEFDECYLIRNDSSELCKAVSSTWMGTRVVKSNANTSPGDCGFVYLCRMNKHWKIVAMHSGRNVHPGAGSDYAYGGMFTQTNLLVGASELATTFQCLSIPLKQTGKNYENQTFSHYPAKSEVWTAVSQWGVQISPIGQFDIQVHGSTMKSEIKPTLYYEDFEDLEFKWCGRSDYWQIPSFKGKMVPCSDGESRWLSPFINSLTPLIRTCKLQEYMFLSIAEFLKDVQFLQTNGFRTLSLNEAVVGIPGSVIQAVDLKTSVGMPFNQPKTMKITVRNREAFIDPSLMEVADEMRDQLKEGLIPCPVALCTLKDEPISFKKNLEFRARVFNCLPFPFNWVCKCETAPLENFFRYNRAFFGSMVGVNMTSMQINDIPNILSRVNPELDRIIACDVSNEDKAEDGDMITYVALIFYAIHHLLTGDGSVAYSLVMGVRNTVYIIKNDAFQMGCQNPSGQDKTVTYNCIITSLTLIYVYYRMKYPDGLPSELLHEVLDYKSNFFKEHGIVRASLSKLLTYRQHCAKVTYGDDSLQSVSRSCSFYDTSKIPSLALELGFKYTDELKSDKIEFRKITEVSFLKRQFTWREDLQSYVGILAKKTIAKMLRLRKKSTLTERDHAAEQLTNVLREFAYESEDDYNAMVERVRSTAAKYDLTENAYLRIEPYSVHLENMRNGSFSTWSPLDVQKREIEEEVFNLEE